MVDPSFAAQTRHQNPGTTPPAASTTVLRAPAPRIDRDSAQRGLSTQSPEELSANSELGMMRQQVTDALSILTSLTLVKAEQRESLLIQNAGQAENVERETQQRDRRGLFARGVEWLTGMNKARAASIEGAQRLITENSRAIGEIDAALSEQQARASNVSLLVRVATEKIQQGEFEAAKISYTAILQLIQSGSASLQLAGVIDQEQRLHASTELQQRFSRVLGNYANTQAGVQAARDGLIATGAVIASGGLGVAAGAALGLGGAAAVNAATAGISIGQGKSAKDVAQQAGLQMLQDAALIFSSVAGAGTARAVMGAAGRAIGVSTAAAVAGAAGAVANTGVAKSIDYVRATQDFLRVVEGRSLTPEALEKAYQNFMEGRRLDLLSLTKDGLANVVSGALGALIGLRANTAERAVQSVLGRLRVQALETSANIAIGLGSAAATGALDERSMVSAVVSAITGDMAARRAAQVGKGGASSHLRELANIIDERATKPTSEAPPRLANFEYCDGGLQLHNEVPVRGSGLDVTYEQAQAAEYIAHGVISRDDIPILRAIYIVDQLPPPAAVGNSTQPHFDPQTGALFISRDKIDAEIKSRSAASAPAPREPRPLVQARKESPKLEGPRVAIDLQPPELRGPNNCIEMHMCQLHCDPGIRPPERTLDLMQHLNPSEIKGIKEVFVVRSLSEHGVSGVYAFGSMSGIDKNGRIYISADSPILANAAAPTLRNERPTSSVGTSAVQAASPARPQLLEYGEYFAPDPQALEQYLRAKAETEGASGQRWITPLRGLPTENPFEPSSSQHAPAQALSTTVLGGTSVQRQRLLVELSSALGTREFEILKERMTTPSEGLGLFIVPDGQLGNYKSSSGTLGPPIPGYGFQPDGKLFIAESLLREGSSSEALQKHLAWCVAQLAPR